MKQLLNVLLLLFVVNPLGAQAEESESKFTNQSELGVVIAGGNTKSQTINLKTNSEYTWTKNLIRGYGALLYGKADGEINARNWNAGLRYERKVGKRFSATWRKGLSSVFQGASNLVPVTFFAVETRFFGNASPFLARALAARGPEYGGVERFKDVWMGGHFNRIGRYRYDKSSYQ